MPILFHFMHCHQRVFEGVVRAKGRLWLANANAFPTELHTSGKHMTIGPSPMPFLAAVYDQDWGAGKKEQETKKRMLKAALKKAGKWLEPSGDRYSEFVCIGVNLNKALIEEKLSAALLTEEESEALGGVQGWMRLKDPLFGGNCAEHFFEHDPNSSKQSRRPTHSTRTCRSRPIEVK